MLQFTYANSQLATKVSQVDGIVFTKLQELQCQFLQNSYASQVEVRCIQLQSLLTLLQVLVVSIPIFQGKKYNVLSHQKKPNTKAFRENSCFVFNL
jgi:hypothetical protein